MEDILVPIAFFGIIPFIVWAVSAYRYKSHTETVKLLDTIATKGEQPITPELVATLGVRRRPKHADLRTGSILIAISLATAFLGKVIPEDEAAQIFLGLAAFPFLVGVVLVMIWVLIGRKDAK